MTKRKTQFVKGLEAGILIAASHLDYIGEDKYRDEILSLQNLTLADMEKSKSA